MAAEPRLADITRSRFSQNVLREAQNPAFLQELILDSVLR